MINSGPEDRCTVDGPASIPNFYTKEEETSPKGGIARLREMGLLGWTVPSTFGGSGSDSHCNLRLLEKLKEIGSFDLSLGRIYEGHINALLLIDTYGSPEQKNFYFGKAVSGKLFGIWNSELGSEALKFGKNSEGYCLQGAKIFCSGAGHVDYPIVTANGEKGSQMVILHQQENCLEEDYRFWQPLGMKASVSCRFDFTGVGFDRTQMLGKAHDYVKEPDFTGGAVRFAAVQLGGAEAAIRATIGHLQKWKRAGAPDQVRRLGQLSILQETGRLWLRGAAQAMDDKKGNPSAYMHYANMFRTATRRICEEVLELCGLCVGLQGMMAPHPLERITRDLMVYLKQPGPDRTLSQVGEYFNVNYKQGE